MTTFSANLGFLWADLPLPEAIQAAGRAGFDAVECHWPYEYPIDAIRAALAETGLPMLGINTVRGAAEFGGAGLTALDGAQDAARRALDQAIDYAAQIGARYVHAMAGLCSHGASDDVFMENLVYAGRRGFDCGIDILIEPINRYDMPDYFLCDTGHAVRVLNGVACDNVKMMFDCYHVQTTEGDVTQRLTALQEHIGHIQIASVPDRSEPDGGELDYVHVCGVLRDLGYARPLGAEYRPKGRVEDNLGWMRKLKEV